MATSGVKIVRPMSSQDCQPEGEGGRPKVIKAEGGIVSIGKWVVWLVFLWTVYPLHTCTRQATRLKEVTLTLLELETWYLRQPERWKFQ